MLIERIVGTDNVGVELQQIIILEMDEVVRVLLLELLALLRHALHRQGRRHDQLQYGTARSIGLRIQE